jgi:hypothetical protein
MATGRTGGTRGGARPGSGRPKGGPKLRTHVTLREDTYEAVRAAAERDARNFSQMVEVLLQRALAAGGAAA